MADTRLDSRWTRDVGMSHLSLNSDKRPLSELRVLEISDGVAGAYASRLLGDLGARVIKVEDKTGVGLRTLGPFPPTALGDIEAGGLHLALDAGKESIVIDFQQSVDVDQFDRLASAVDIVLLSRSTKLDRTLLERHVALRDKNPELVLGVHTPFGVNGPYSDRSSSEIVDYAMGGYMYFSGDPEREPLLAPGFQAEFHAGMQLAFGAMVGAYHSLKTGQGQTVEVSTFESMLNAHSWLTSSWTHEGIIQSRKETWITKCLDGHVFWMPRPDPQFFAMIERPDLIDDPRLDSMLEFRDAVPEYRAAFADWAKNKKKQDIYHEAQALRIAVTPVNDAEDLGNSQQLRAREFWRTVDSPVGKIEIPGPPWNFSDVELGPVWRAPHLGEHQDLELQERLPRVYSEPEGSLELPLSGVRVLEITANWAGPLTGRHLGDLGADVIKIEVAKKPATRAVTYPGQQGWDTAHNRAAYFNLLNRNKRDLGVDLSDPAGRDLFLDLVEKSDIVLENNSARVFPSLGLDYENLRARNEKLIMCSMSGMGLGGPEMQYLAYGSNIEASSGFVARLGYSEDSLFSSGSFYADPICGTHGAIGLVASLFSRDSGSDNKNGRFIDMSLQESGIIFNTESIMNFQIRDEIMTPVANESSRWAPQGVYPTVGEDCWIAIVCQTDVDWVNLCNVIFEDGLSTVYISKFEDLSVRKESHAEINKLILSWTSQFNHNEATRLLQAGGVSAGPVLQNWEIVSDPHLFERDYFVDIVHPDVGHFRWDGFPWKFSSTKPQIQRPAPLFGEHTVEISRDIAGLSQDEIDHLKRAGVIQDRLEVVT